MNQDKQDVKPDGKMKREDYRGMYHFVCECGGQMATNGQALDIAIMGDKYFRCPNRFYNKCNRSYSARQFKELAHYSYPPKFGE